MESETDEELTNRSERFWRKVKKGTDSECWYWLRGTTYDGYGIFWIGDGKTTTAHRFSWELANGPIADGYWVLHKCDTPYCVNPAHLFLGTEEDNRNDKLRKGRSHAYLDLGYNRQDEIKQELDLLHKLVDQGKTTFVINKALRELHEKNPEIETDLRDMELQFRIDAGRYKHIKEHARLLQTSISTFVRRACLFYARNAKVPMGNALSVTEKYDMHGSIVITQDQKYLIQQIAEQHDISMSEFVRRAALQYSIDHTQ
jgi:uncharacterized protein (DUF1778 family)